MMTLTKIAVAAALVLAPVSGVALAKSHKAPVTQTHVKKHVVKRSTTRTTTGAAPSVRSPHDPASCGGGSMGYNAKCVQPGD